MRLFLLILFLLFLQYSPAQKITYAFEGDISTAKTGYHIIGKINGRYFVHVAQYKNYLSPSGGHFMILKSSLIYVYDKDMRLVAREKLDLPKAYFGVRFILNPLFCYMIYEYINNHHSYCMAVKLDSNGKMLGTPNKLAETELGDFRTNAPVYNIIESEDKSRIALFTMGEYQDMHQLTVFILNQKLKRTDEKQFDIPRYSFQETFSDFNIDNNGNFVFLRKDESEGSDLRKYIIGYTQRDSSNASFFVFNPLGIRLNRPALALNNTNGILHFFSIYTDSSLNLFGGDITLSEAKKQAGLFDLSWNLKNRKLVYAASVPFISFIDSTSEDQELMKVPVQDIALNKMYKKNGQVFLLEASTSNSNRHALNHSEGENEPGTVNGYIQYEDFEFNLSETDHEKSIKTDADFLIFLLDGHEQVSKFLTFSSKQVNGRMTMDAKNGIHYFILHNKKNHFITDHIFIKNSGEVDRLPPINNLMDHEILPESARQVDKTELLFSFKYNKKLNFGKLEY